MIICLCGLIGSGKTTYACEHMDDNDEIIDFDKIKKQFKVEENKIAKQITLDLLKDAVEDDAITWFVTTIPDLQEQALLNKTEVKYLWLYNEIPKTIENIQRRNRYSDIQNLDKIYIKNVKLLKLSTKFIRKYNVKIIGGN